MSARLCTTDRQQSTFTAFMAASLPLTCFTVQPGLDGAVRPVASTRTSGEVGLQGPLPGFVESPPAAGDRTLAGGGGVRFAILRMSLRLGEKLESAVNKGTAHLWKTGQSRLSKASRSVWVCAAYEGLAGDNRSG